MATFITWKIHNVDTRVFIYYNENDADKPWGKLESHQIMLNVSQLGMDRTVALIKGIYLQEKDK